MNSTYLTGLMEKFSETMHVNTWYRTTPFCSRTLNMIQESVSANGGFVPISLGWRFSREKLWQKAEMHNSSKVPLEWQRRVNVCTVGKGRGWLPDGGETAGAFRKWAVRMLLNVFKSLYVLFSMPARSFSCSFYWRTLLYLWRPSTQISSD